MRENKIIIPYTGRMNTQQALGIHIAYSFEIQRDGPKSQISFVPYFSKKTKYDYVLCTSFQVQS